MVDFLITHGANVSIFCLAILGFIFFVFNQRKNIKEWLLFAVIEAEKQFGSKTGKIKLRQVYDWFINTFPIASKFISFNAFSTLVDLALDEMEKLLGTNQNIKQYVEGEQ